MSVFRIFAWLSAALIFPAAASGKERDYEGADAGYVVYAVGTTKIGMKFDFSYHRLATGEGQPVDDWDGTIKPTVGGAIYLKIKNPDFVGEESGHVVVRRLPPGSYEVNNYYFSGFLPGVATYRWSPARPFSLPFRVRSGEATYIGSFMRSPSLGTSLQPVLGAAGFFVVADRSERDLPIAAGRLGGSITINKEVTDVSTFESAALRTGQP